MAVDADTLLEDFLELVAEQGLSLYSAQEEAILELFAGNNVILNTPTGSGKSLVALAAHHAALAQGQRSFYTAPIKALVSEKFFALCRDLGSDNVGMMTGDASVNPDAPVICCTAEILSNLALRWGEHAPVDQVVMDEFHFYADRDRGVAWQVPLLELSQCQFLLMSATLGNTHRFETELTERTGRHTALVKSTDRPVPLDFEYKHTPLHESIAQLIESGATPTYVVHFTQRNATEHAQSMTSVEVTSKTEKAAIKEAIGGFRFDSPFGKDLRRFVSHGVGVHHAGLLPKYRLLVEKLAQEGHLKVICGTDTLGVGINVPIRTVLFTQLCKYDGESTRVLRVREFQQIAGRAGRKGFDDRGSVWVQAPPHVIENERMDEKAAADPKKKRKMVKKKPPERGYAHWSGDTMTKLAEGQPEALTSSFHVSHGMLLELLDRPGDGCAAVRKLLTENHDDRKAQRSHIRRAISIYRSLVEGGIVEQLDEPDDQDRMVRVDLGLQEDFRLNQPLSPFVIDLVDQLDPEAPDYHLDVLTVVESVLENPGVVLFAQVDKLKGELVSRLKSEGVEYEERMEKLDEVTYPKPRQELIYEHFNAFAATHPWVGTDNISPKSVARDLYERAMTFREYVNHYGLKRSEGVLLRYLSDAYKGVVQTVPEDAKTDELDDLVEWLGALIRQVDSSLIDEWERLKNPEEIEAGPVLPPEPPDITTNERAFRVMVRNVVFTWVQLLSRKRPWELAELVGWETDDLLAAMAPYWEEHESLDAGSIARGHEYFLVDATSITQILLDPEDTGEWRIEATIDLDASREQDRAVVRLDAITREDGSPIS